MEIQFQWQLAGWCSAAQRKLEVFEKIGYIDRTHELSIMLFSDWIGLFRKDCHTVTHTSNNLGCNELAPLTGQFLFENLTAKADLADLQMELQLLLLLIVITSKISWKDKLEGLLRANDGSHHMEESSSSIDDGSHRRYGVFSGMSPPGALGLGQQCLAGTDMQRVQTATQRHATSFCCFCDLRIQELLHSMMIL